ncbi:LpqB family beta-propeller domain-containing protein [Cellulomonas marina]|uniref:Sporulation and spore germination n=1 Tax=Cellulomonas marina TaxID=988821 RepID=A0A1I0V074_9CELL|nr:LpqB family beta-propeller domain-containing protein [Cellulomonas marina]GIG28234.1 hypothetical protein Cma02nite_08340 [Cellulomonas marina]SFA69715.1 Sporulation and spore germination [Cellulomonas marina]
MRAPTGPRALRRRRGVLAPLVAALLVVLAGCVSIPTSGPVTEGAVAVDEGGRIDVLAEGPQEGAQPEEIVQGFLLAGAAGFGDDFVVARQFLTGDARAEWSPLAGVVVAGSVDLQRTSTSEVSVSVPVVARVDADGRYAEAAAGAAQQVTYGLVQGASGEWRIASLPDGLVLPRSVFATQFRSAPLWFLSPDRTSLVPEVRWFPERNLATAVVQALLAGPSPWLRDAVATAVPDGARLVGSVPVDAAGVAQVTLAPPAAVLEADRGLLLAQLEATLALPRVSRAQVSSGDVVLEDPVALESGVVTSGAPEMLQDGSLVRLAGGGLEPVDEVGSLAGLGARSPARSEDGSVRVLLTDAGLVRAPSPGGEPVVLVPGADLAAPGVDRLGWAWTARTGDGGGLWAAGPDGAVVEVTADWLDDRRVRSLRVSRDATRVAVVSEGVDGVAVDVAGVVRDEGGVPRTAGEAVRVGASLVDATSVAWVDATTLAVVGRSTGAPALHLVPVAGATVVQPELSDLAAVAAGRGGRNLLAATTEGSLYRLDGPSWVRVAGVEDVRDPSYPG